MLISVWLSWAVACQCEGHTIPNILKDLRLLLMVNLSLDAALIFCLISTFSDQCVKSWTVLTFTVPFISFLWLITFQCRLLTNTLILLIPYTPCLLSPCLLSLRLLSPSPSLTAADVCEVGDQLVTQSCSFNRCLLSRVWPDYLLSSLFCTADMLNSSLFLFTFSLFFLSALTEQFYPPPPSIKYKLCLVPICWGCCGVHAAEEL